MPAFLVVPDPDDSSEAAVRHHPDLCPTYYLIMLGDLWMYDKQTRPDTLRDGTQAGGGQGSINHLHPTNMIMISIGEHRPESRLV